MQLLLDLSPPARPCLHRPWLDITPSAVGIGFHARVEISLSLHDALQPRQDEYDQRLYDALWLAHFQLALDSARVATFVFAHGETALRLRVELNSDSVRLGLPQDFQETPCPTISANATERLPSSTARAPQRRSRTAISTRR